MYDCIELSYGELTAQCRRWCVEIEKEFRPHVVIFVAKAGFPMGMTLAEHFCSALGAVSAEREGNRLKKALQPVLTHIPYRVRNYLIERELNSDFHRKHTERNVRFLTDLSPWRDAPSTVLLVDDSVDTGETLRQVKEGVEDYLGYSVKTAALNVWDKSRETIEVDFSLYRNTIIKAPMSKDSKEYTYFRQQYDSFMRGIRATGTE